MIPDATERLCDRRCRACGSQDADRTFRKAGQEFKSRARQTASRFVRIEELNARVLQDYVEHRCRVCGCIDDTETQGTIDARNTKELRDQLSRAGNAFLEIITKLEGRT